MTPAEETLQRIHRGAHSGAGRQQLFREAEEPLTILDRDAHDVGDHVHRQLVRNLLHEVTLAAFQGVLDDRHRPLARLFLEPPHHARGETRADQAALTHVRAPVHADEHRAAHLGLDAECRAVERAEQLGVAVRSLHVGVARERPEARIVVAGKVGCKRLPVNRRFTAQRREHVVGKALPEDPGVGEVDVEYVDVGHAGIVAGTGD